MQVELALKSEKLCEPLLGQNLVERLFSKTCKYLALAHEGNWPILLQYREFFPPLFKLLQVI